MGANFEEVRIKGQLFRRYTKRDNLPSCDFVQGQARTFTETSDHSSQEDRKKGKIYTKVALDIVRCSDLWTVAGHNFKNTLRQKLPSDFNWQAEDVSTQLESHRFAVLQCFPDDGSVSLELKENLIDNLSQDGMLQRPWALVSEPTQARGLFLAPQLKSVEVNFIDENTAELTEVMDCRSYFYVEERTSEAKTLTIAEKEPAFLTIRTTQRVSVVDGKINIDYTEMTYDVKASEKELCAATSSLFSDEALGLVDSKLTSKLHDITSSGSGSSCSQISAITFDVGVSEYPERRALFAESLEEYKAMQAALSGDRVEEFQACDPIYTAGQKLLTDIDKTAEAVDTDGIGHLATVLEYATEKLEDVTKQNGQSSSVLQSSSVVMPKKCSEGKYKHAIRELQSDKHDNVVFRAMRFLEVVATAIVNGFLLAVTAIANSAPALTFVPPATAPHVDLPPSPATRRKEEMSGSLGLFFKELSKQHSAVPPSFAMVQPFNGSLDVVDGKGKGKEKATKRDGYEERTSDYERNVGPVSRHAPTPFSITVGGR